MQTPWKFLLSLGLTHFVADAISGFTVTSTALGHSLWNISLIILSYNIVAFALQPLAGLIVDQWSAHRLAVIGGMSLMGIGLLAFLLHPIIALMIIAIASALIHVGAGALSIHATPTKSVGAALFTAPGVIGLTLGTLTAIQSVAIVPALLIGTLVVVGLLLTINTTQEQHPLHLPLGKGEGLPLIALLVLFVALRSTLWLHESATVIPMMILAFGLAAGIGKLAGGFVADRFGRTSTVVVGTVFAILCFFEGSSIMVIIGIAALQSSTGVILSASVQKLPKYSATVAGFILGFGLALAGILATILTD